MLDYYDLEILQSVNPDHLIVTHCGKVIAITDDRGEAILGDVGQQYPCDFTIGYPTVQKGTEKYIPTLDGWLVLSEEGLPVDQPPVEIGVPEGDLTKWPKLLNHINYTKPVPAVIRHWRVPNTLTASRVCPVQLYMQEPEKPIFYTIDCFDNLVGVIAPAKNVTNCKLPKWVDTLVTKG